MSWYHARMTVAERIVPRTSRRTRLFVATFVWTGVGLGLLIAGLRWTFLAPSIGWRLALPLALVVGWVKGRFVLAPRATRNATRILHSSESVCVGAAFSWGAWALAGSMTLLGIGLRHSALPRPWLGLLYAAVGTALLTAGAGGWQRWRELGLTRARPTC